MASYHQIQQFSRVPFESPAKVFAKLKSKVQRAAVVEEDECQSAEFNRVLYTPKRRTESHGTDKPGDFSQIQKLGNGEVTALTLSPISSPQKHHQYITDCDRLNCTDTEHVFNPTCMPRQRAPLESTAVCSTTDSQTHMDGFHTAKTSDRFVLCEPGDLENAVPPHFISPVFSPMRTRLRKRKADNQLLNKPNGMVSDTDYVSYPEKERKISPAFREDAHITNTRNMEPFSHVAPGHNGCTVETLPHNLMSPAKMFIYLKERENQRDQCDVLQVASSSRPEVDQDIQIEMRMGPDSTASSVSRQQSPNSGVSDEEFPYGPVSDLPSQPVLLEDPLVLNSPRVSIPKTQEIVYRRAKWPHCTTFPSENVIHLRKWFIRGNHKGLFVDGIHRENNIPWNSNIILDRVSNSALKTISGRVYILVGKMNWNGPSQFPKWFLKSFVNGFPSNWKELHKKYLSESKGNVKKVSEAQNHKKSQKSKTSMDQLLKQQQQQTSPPCPSSAASSTKVSRSGRVIKPPLNYWMGGRVTLDAYMNVTIHDGYSNSVIQPKTETSISTKSFISTPPDKSTARGKVPLNNVCEKHESNPKQQLQRKVKAQRRKPHQHNVIVLKKPPSPEKTNTSDRVTRSSQKCPPTEKTSENTKSQGSKNTNKKATKAKGGAKAGHRSTSTRRSPPDAISTASQPLTNKENVLKKTKDKSTDKSQPNLHCKPTRCSHSSNSSQEREKCTHKSQTNPVKDMKTQRKRTTKTPSPKNANAPIFAQKTAQPNMTCIRTARMKVVTEQDEDKWTEEELRKLQEAVSCHPKHIAGYWTKVAMMVGTRSAEECQKQHTSKRAAKTPSKYERKTKKRPLKEKANPVISARVGTLRRKQQVRDFLESMPKEDMDDVFSTAYMQNKRFEVPSMCTSDHDFSLSDQEPLTPRPTGLAEAKTPQCLHITPGMMGDSSRNYDDKYVFQLQKRMKNNYQFNVEKQAKKVKANLTPASVKKTMRRCGNTENDTFVVWEMFPDKEETQADSDEEKDFYFTECD